MVEWCWLYLFGPHCWVGEKRADTSLVVSLYLARASQAPAMGRASRVQPGEEKWCCYNVMKVVSTCDQVAQDLNPHRVDLVLVLDVSKVSPGEDQENGQDAGSCVFPGNFPVESGDS